MDILLCSVIWLPLLSDEEVYFSTPTFWSGLLSHFDLQIEEVVTFYDFWDFELQIFTLSALGISPIL